MKKKCWTHEFELKNNKFICKKCKLALSREGKYWYDKGFKDGYELMESQMHDMMDCL